MKLMYICFNDKIGLVTTYIYNEEEKDEAFNDLDEVIHNVLHLDRYKVIDCDINYIKYYDKVLKVTTLEQLTRIYF